MLGYIKEHPEVDYVIVHKLDCLARNRVDDVDINRVFDECNVRLISTSENIDQTPGGMLLHGIMSAIAEFYSRNLGHEVTKGMSQKAKNGGTNGRAPLGYVNKRGKNGDGKDTAWVEIDPERGPHITEAFRLYATGDWKWLSWLLILRLLGLRRALPADIRQGRSVRTSCLAFCVIRTTGVLLSTKVLSIPVNIQP